MKKGFIVGCLLFLVLNVLGAYSLDNTDISSIGSGSAGLALISAASSLANPAALYYRGIDNSSLYVSGSYNDTIVPSNFSNNEANPLLEAPISNFCVSFSGSNLALTFETKSSLTDRIVDIDGTSYVANSSTLFQLDWAVGTSTLAFGLSLRAVSYSERSPVEIRSDHLLGDYFVETILGKYETLEDESTISAGLGLLLNYDWFKMGVTSDSFAYSKGGNALAISSESLFKTLDWGFALSSPVYDRTNQLNLFKFEAAMDLCNIGDADTREVRFGADLKLQLLPYWSVSLKTGYRETKPTLTDFFAVVPSNGVHTLGLSVLLNRFSLDLACAIPLEWYIGTRNEDSSVAVTLAMSLSV
ncbi:hypothetical protein [uncultured Sphaerochaeta sp.]|uniref:hypothetical protein n=1 Tax=uncultured Sphaerochaeta sp. TaxID=886478 RepID=UPI002A0A6B40|nr:hypothetical protein [uncultured Sphaerochaeta sp.]